MQQVARYPDYNQQHHNTRAQLSTAAGTASLYEAPSPVQSVESPPGSEAAGTANSTSNYQQHYQQRQQPQLRKGSNQAVTSSVSAVGGMNLQPSPVSLQQPSSAVDYSNGTTTVNSGSNGRLEVVGNVDNSCSVPSYMPAYCLAQPSHTVTSVSDVYHQQQQQQNVYQQQQLVDVESSNLKLRMQQDSGGSTTTVTTPEVISMLKNPDFDIVTSTTANMLYDNDKVLDQAGIMRDLVKPVTCSTSDPMKQQNFNMDGGAHCSTAASGGFPQHLGSLQKDYFSIHDQQERGGGGGATVHHMGHPDLHYPTLQMPNALQQHNQMIVPVKAEPPHGMMCGSPPLSPIDMDHQEAIKSERKRMRNRIAAHKCRRRKLERISKLEDKVATLKNHNQELNNNINMLKQQVTDLKAKVLDHVNQGCEIIIDQRQLIM